MCGLAIAAKRGGNWGEASVSDIPRTDDASDLHWPEKIRGTNIQFLCGQLEIECRMLRLALGDVIDLADAYAQRFHDEMEGYKLDEHKEIDERISAARMALVNTTPKP